MDIPEAKVTADGVYIGGEKLPGIIKAEGVTARGEWGGINTLTVEFIVDRVTFDGEDNYPTTRAQVDAVNPYADLKCASLYSMGNKRELCDRESHHEGPHRANGFEWSTTQAAF